MHYFSFISNTYSCKNKLEKDILAFLKTQDRTIIPAREIGIFKANIDLGIAKINATHLRCKSIKTYWWMVDRETEINLGMGGGIANFHLYASIN